MDHIFLCKLKLKLPKENLEKNKLYSFKLGKNFYRYDTKNMIYFF